jgi:hypothetical protein
MKAIVAGLKEVVFISESFLINGLGVKEDSE